MANMFSSHLHWHNALFKLHTGQFDVSSQILSTEVIVSFWCICYEDHNDKMNIHEIPIQKIFMKIIKKRLTLNDSLSLNDATSLLYRLKIHGKFTICPLTLPFPTVISFFSYHCIPLQTYLLTPSTTTSQTYQSFFNSFPHHHPSIPPTTTQTYPCLKT